MLLHISIDQCCMYPLIEPSISSIYIWLQCHFCSPSSSRCCLNARSSVWPRSWSWASLPVLFFVWTSVAGSYPKTWKPFCIAHFHCSRNTLEDNIFPHETNSSFNAKHSNFVSFHSLIILLYAYASQWKMLAF